MARDKGPTGDPHAPLACSGTGPSLSPQQGGMAEGWPFSRGVWNKLCARVGGQGRRPKALPVCICHQGQPPIVPGYLPEDGEQEQQCLREEEGLAGGEATHALD